MVQLSPMHVGYNDLFVARPNSNFRRDMPAGERKLGITFQEAHISSSKPSSRHAISDPHLHVLDSCRCHLLSSLRAGSLFSSAIDASSNQNVLSITCHVLTMSSPFRAIGSSSHTREVSTLVMLMPKPRRFSFPLTFPSTLRTRNLLQRS